MTQVEVMFVDRLPTWPHEHVPYIRTLFPPQLHESVSDFIGNKNLPFRLKSFRLTFHPMRDRSLNEPSATIIG